MDVTLLVTNEKATTKKVRLGELTLIGRSRECNLRIPSGQVSRKHCLIRIDGARVLVRDLGSANGTEVDGATIPPEIDVPVAPGSTLVVGPLNFVFDYNPPPPMLAASEEDDLQSTTQDISPLPTAKIDHETKDYSPSQLEQRLSESNPEADSSELDFSEGVPNSPAAMLVGNKPVPSAEGSNRSNPTDTVFDSGLSDRDQDPATPAPPTRPPLETGTDLLVDDAQDGHSLQSLKRNQTDTGTGAPDLTEIEDEDAAVPPDGEQNASRKRWKILDFLQRSGKGEPAATRSPSSPNSDPPASAPPAGPSTSPPEDLDSDLQDFFQNPRP